MTRWLLALALVGCVPEPVDAVVLSPESLEVAEVLRAADARWEAAGVAPERIVVAYVGGEGAPVRLVPGRAPVAETRIRKHGGAWSGVRWIELYSLDVDVATHELGHALGVEWATDVSVHLPDTDCAGPVAERPTMCAHVGGVITEADLLLACDVGACVGFSPEG